MACANAMLELNQSVYFVPGAYCGAIYDLVHKKVFSVNSAACDIIRSLRNGGRVSDVATRYRSKLVAEGLLRKDGYVNELSDAELEFAEHRGALDLAWLEVTQACNLKCVHCYEGQEHRDVTSVLDINRWMDVVNQLSELGVGNVVLIGGEPTLYGQLPVLISALSAKEIRTTMITNATYLPRDLVDLVARTNTSVRISVYGHCASVHDAITQTPGSFERTMSNLKILLSEKVTININVVIMRENETHLHEIQTFVKNLGVSGCKFDVIRCVYGVGIEQHLPVTQASLRLGRRCKPEFSITKDRFWDAVRYNTCWNRKIAICNDGKVFPCVFARTVPAGNVLDSSIGEILNSSKLQECWSLNLDKIDKCRQCEFRYACKDCRPVAMSVRNCKTDKSPICCYDPERGVWVDAGGA